MAPHTIYEFGPYRLDVSTRRLFRGEELIPLTPKAFDILAALTERRDRVVDKAELMKLVWPNSFVEEANLSQTIFVLRKTLGEDADGNQYIETVPRRGYRFAAAVVTVEAPASQPTVTAAAAPPSRHWAIWAGAAAAAAILLAVALAWRSGSRDVAIRSLAVLPLGNLSGQPSEQYFVDGLTEALISDLAQIQALRVVARTSTAGYRDTTKPSPQVGRELGVDGLITGSVVRSGERVRVSVQLIDSASDRHVWAQAYERQLSDILDLQREIARTVAQEVRAVLTPDEQSRLQRTSMIDPRAHDEYLKGRFEFNKRSRAGFVAAIRHFESATAIDPTLAHAYSGLADVYTLSAGFFHVAPRAAIPPAKAAALKALEIDRDLADAYVSLGYIHFRYDYDFPEADTAFRRAIALNPNSDQAHLWYGLSLGWAGRFADARSELDRAVLLDPLSIPILGSDGWLHYLSRDYDRAVAVFDRAIVIDPSSPVAYRRRGWAYQMLGRHDDAIASFQRAHALSRGELIEVAALARGYAMAGRRDDAANGIVELQKRDPGGELTAYSIGEIYAAMGDVTAALQWLERAYETRSIWLIFLKTEPIFDQVRSQPRFQALVDRIRW